MECPPLPLLPSRPIDSHKGNYGNALLIGGSRGMSGAIALAGMAALRTGAGLVRLGVPDCCLDTVAGFSPCLMAIPIPSDSAGRSIRINEPLRHWIAASSCLALGPGLGRSNEVTRFVFDVIGCLAKDNAKCPLVIDADGLYALSGHPNWRDEILNPLVLTPHPGEWSRLCGISPQDPQGQSAAAIEFAAERDCIIVLKGHRSLVTDGRCSLRNHTGSPAMAIGGSGDGLTGVITGLICQKMGIYDSARLACHLHGLAGQIASERRGLHVVLPTELIDSIPDAFNQCAVRNEHG